MGTHILPPAGFVPNAERTVTITVNYNGFTPEAQAAFQYAVDIWASLLTSSVSIVVDATWEDLPGNTLGSAGPNFSFINFSGAPEADTYYPAPLADKLAGFDLNPGEPDIVASFDSGTDWYLGTDANPGFNQFDFVSVVLHELGHGLGVVGSSNVDGGVGSIGFGGNPFIYDTFVENGSGTSILSFTNNSTSLATQLESGNLFWNGAEAVNADGGTNPGIFAPDPYEPGSSFSHWDESYFPAGNSNSLMTPYIGFQEAIHDPGAVTLGLMSDIGWELDLGTGGGGCSPVSLILNQEPCQDEGLGAGPEPVIGITFEIDGDCMVEELCFSENGGAYECFDMPALDFILFDGDQINLTQTVPNVTYDFYFTTADGTSGVYSWNNGNCTDDTGCTNPYADNYNPSATTDDGSCNYSENICDCAGTEHTIGVLVWLGDGFADAGDYTWDGQLVDFNCDTWGYDCGDISGSPGTDPYGVCSGALPPNNGCVGDCSFNGITVYTDGCNPDTNTDAMQFLFDYEGECTVSEICAYPTADPASVFCFDLTANNLGDGDVWGITGLTAENWSFYYTLNDGSISPTGTLTIGSCSPVSGCTNPFATNYNPDADNDDGSCLYDETICDCAGTEHTIGVLAWLGDGFADDAAYEWDGELVDFECDTWGYDCGDIAGSPTDDPYGVCSGALPPNNGCGPPPVTGCTDATACNYDPLATEDDGSCEYLTCAGCTNANACNYDATATLDDGSCEFVTCAGCTNANACNFDPAATIDDGSCEFVTCAGCMNPMACNYDITATIDDGSCEFITCAGCTDDFACNYDPTATLDDGTCEYTSCAGCTNPNACNYDPTAVIDDDSCDLESCLGCTDPAALNYDPTATIDDGSCFYVEVLGCIDPIACNYNSEANTDDGSCEYLTCAGCIDEIACNFDPTATIDDDSCEYESCAGCMDPEACNYDETATLDDGSCDYESCAGCTDPEALNYDPEAILDDGSCVYDCEYPTLTWSTFCEDGETDVFYIELDIDALGNGAPYLVTNNINSDEYQVSFNGTVEIGPFTNDTDVLVTVGSIPFANCLLTSPLLSDNCTGDGVEEADLAPAVFPNPATNRLMITPTQGGMWQASLFAADGRRVAHTTLNTPAGETATWLLPELATGLYTLQLAQNSTVQTVRVVLR